MLLILFVGGLILGACIIEFIDCSIYNASMNNKKDKRKKERR